ncbi:exported protein of unknown function [Magnetospirillum gryphiswaldense MSR-1 v2]|uniref:Uncharacterized protein n=1 Tax=Magnetospirillum gryphiswaldense (strain DSM 6361 / JCM 21280 / NBRC 15271 / MSR-1) TaxID=431944 RepID=V6EXZ7_MAGGM|nr:exported protein of unknown function [Magnetospirillum gryphiswaldense MSR-1 v2]
MWSRSLTLSVGIVCLRISSFADYVWYILQKNYGYTSNSIVHNDRAYTFVCVSINAFWSSFLSLSGILAKWWKGVLPVVAAYD